MTIPELTLIAKKRIAYLNAMRSSAEAIGDIAHLDRIDAEIAETQTTLTQLEMLNT
jgi:hypothetical protein